MIQSNKNKEERLELTPREPMTDEDQKQIYNQEPTKHHYTTTRGL